MYHRRENGELIRGLSALPDKDPSRPMLFVGNHQYLTLDLSLIMERLLEEKVSHTHIQTLYAHHLIVSFLFLLQSPVPLHARLPFVSGATCYCMLYQFFVVMNTALCIRAPCHTVYSSPISFVLARVIIRIFMLSLIFCYREYCPVD